MQKAEIANGFRLKNCKIVIDFSMLSLYHYGYNE